MIKIINKQRLISTLITVAIIFFVVATLALIEVLFSHRKGFEWGTVSDWFSALCNLATAVAAVYAAFNAKQWFSQRSHTKGFDKAEELLSNVDSLYHCTSSLFEKLDSSLKLVNLISGNLRIPSNSEAEEYAILQKQTEIKIKELDNIKNNLEVFERWSIEIKNKDIILDTIKCIRDANVSAVNSFISVQSSIHDINTVGRYTLNMSIDNFKRYYTEHLSDLAILESKYNTFKKQKFINLFEVK